MKNEEIKAHLIGYLPDTDIRKKLIEMLDNQQWISTQYQLPPFGEEVLLCTKYKDVIYGCWAGDTFECYTNRDYYFVSRRAITHWMPLTEPPEVEE